MIAQFNDFEINAVHGGDAWKICDLCVINADRFKRYFPKTLEQNLTPTLSELFVEKKLKQFREKEEFLFTIKETETRRLVGLVYIKELDWHKKQGEFAYCIGYQFEGKGVISSAIKELSQYAFKDLGLKTLQIISHESNMASIKVAKKNGFIWEKQLQSSYTPPNSEPLNMELYELHKIE